MSFLGKVTGVTKVEKLFDDISRKAPAEADGVINSQSKIAKKIIQKNTPKKTGTLRKAIANKKIRKADEFTKVLSINKRKAPYGYRINAKKTIIKKGLVVAPYTDGQFFEKAQPKIEASIEAAINNMKVI
jgi:predicted  nucleic acid-binding Zn-ribbon protein